MAPYLLAFTMLAAPVFAGLGFGRMLSRAPAWVGWLAALAPLGLIAAWRIVPLGLWDLALIGALLSVSIALGLRAAKPLRAIAVSLVVLLLGAGALELVGLALPEPPSFPAPEEAHFVFMPTRMNHAQDVLYGDASRTIVDEGALEGDTRPHVLHLGDSMIYGEGVDRPQTTTAWLNRMDPGVVHVNLGVPGTGPDVHLILLRRWLDVVKPKVVVHHLFIGNDVEDIDQPSAACDGETLLDYRPEGPVARCPTPRWKLSFRDWFRASPPPYPLRIATDFSRVASHLCGGFGRLAVGLEMPTERGVTGAQSSPEKWAHLEAILKAERDELTKRGIRLVGSVLPWRDALAQHAPRETPAWESRTRMLSVLEKLQIPALDAWPLFERCVKEQGAPACFIDPPSWEIHLNANGHRRYAEWLRSLPTAGLPMTREAQAEALPPPSASDLAIPPGREPLIQQLLQQWWDKPTDEFTIDAVNVERTMVRLKVDASGTKGELHLRRPDEAAPVGQKDRLITAPDVMLAVLVRCSACDAAQASTLEKVAQQILTNQATAKQTLWQAVTRSSKEH